MSDVVVLQPAGNQGGREHYVDTVANLVGIDSCEPYVAPQILRKLSELHPNGKAAMWGVIPGKMNTGKWEKIGPGNLVLFSADGYIHTSGIVSMKFTSERLANHLWKKNDSGETWSLMYALDEIKQLKISYEEFNKVVGYKPNFVIQGFNVLDPERSARFLDYFSLRSERHVEDVTDEEFEEAILGLDGELDRKATGWHRKEQQKARKRLLKGKTIGACLICGKSMSAEFLIAAHIKKRSECRDDEKRDLDGVMMLACKFGCDYLYEAGYLGVEKGAIRVSSKLTDPIGLKYAEEISGRQIDWQTKQYEYFQWHLKYRFQD